MRSLVKPGASTLDLEKAAVRASQIGAKPAFKAITGFLCAMRFGQQRGGAWHSSPKRILKEEILFLSTLSIRGRLLRDAAITVPVGEKIDPDTARLLRLLKPLCTRHRVFGGGNPGD